MILKTQVEKGSLSNLPAFFFYCFLSSSCCSKLPCFIVSFLFYLILFIYLFILGLHPWHMEGPRLGIQSELQLPAYATATAKQDPSCILRPTPQLMAMPDPHPTERGQGSNRCLHGCWSGWLTTEPCWELLCWILNLLSHNGNASCVLFKDSGLQHQK